MTDDPRISELEARINRIDAGFAKQLELSIARNSRMVTRLKNLIPVALHADPEMQDLHDDIMKIINDQDPD